MGENRTERSGFRPSVGALEALARAFGLTEFECDVVAAAAESALEGRGTVTFGALLDEHPAPEWDALLPDRPLRAFRLLMVGDGPLLGAPVVLDERILHHLQGRTTLDERLAPYLAAVHPPTGALTPSRRELATRLASAWDDGGRSAAVLLHGPDADDRLDVAAAAGARAGARVHRLAARDVPVGAVERDALARLWNREARLDVLALVIECDDAPPDVVAAAEALLARLEGRLVLSATSSVALRGVGASLEVPRPPRDEQLALWTEVLGSRHGAPIAERLADEFDFSHSDIRRAERWSLAGPTDPVAAVAQCAATVRHRMSGLAQRIEPRATWDDLVLPPTQLQLVRQIAAAAAGRRRVHALTAARVSKRGHGLSVMFSGPSGTGKTLAAEVLAGELQLDLHRVDLASVVSKWVGETEKHLRQVFDAADCGGTLLLFDEADALFGRRSEVRDSHDRYANLEVSYLLQRIEQFRGVVVLTTNMRSALDPAFMRRLRYVVQFPHPDPDQRAQLWSRAFSSDVATEGLDIERLARVDLTGGDITSVAAHAVLLAAAEDAPVRMDHIRAAAVAELVKLERPLAELGAW